VQGAATLFNPHKENPMSIMPHGEEIRKAVTWISEMRLDNPAADPQKLVEQACLKFNLSPLEAEYLARWVKGQE
jgi:hypothetical protein